MVKSHYSHYPTQHKKCVKVLINLQVTKNTIVVGLAIEI